MKSISERQLRNREILWGGSLEQSRGAMYKNVIAGLASGASGHHTAKPFGLGRRVDDAFARWKLMFLSGETLIVCDPLADCTGVGNDDGTVKESAEGIIVVCTEGACD